MAETERAGLERTGQRGAEASGGPVEKATAMVSAMQQRLMAMPVGKRTWLIASAAFLAAACVGMIWFAQRPDWRVLFSGLDGKDTQQVSQELAAASIPFEMTADGAGVEVPADMLDKARMEVAAKGMPQSGRLGFELFDKPNWVGSEFDERVNYQRALEGELEHTIDTLGVVRSARVHLVLPQQSLFASEEKVAKASVVLKLRRATIDPEQADAIRSLVAGAVENLSPDQVTLVDADGRANLKPRSGDASKDEAEQEMEAKLVAMLEPLAGRDNVRATVNVSYDDGSEERTDEIYDPSQTATLSMQKREQTSVAPEKATGVPGTASNSPAGAPAGSVAGSQAAAAPGTPPLLQKQALPVYPQQSTPPQTAKSESGTYGASKTVRHRVENPGRVRRLTAAIVVNDRQMQSASKNKAAVWQPRSADELRNLTALAQAAVGFDTTRGDMLTVEDLAFDENRAETPASPVSRALNAAENSPVLIKYAVLLTGIVVVMAFGVRPALRRAGSASMVPLKGAGRELPGQAAAKPALRTPEAPAPDPERTRAQDIFEQVTVHLKNEPAQSSRLLQSWIHSD